MNCDPLIVPFLIVLGYAWWVAFTVLRHSDKRADKLSARTEELEKQIADLKTAQRRANRASRTISVKGHRLDKRVKQLEKINKREKTNETPIRNARASSYDAGLKRGPRR